MTLIRKALASFGGVKRRFTRTGEWNGVTDHRRLRPSPGRDRGRAARGAWIVRRARIIAVMQPHRYTRLQGIVRAILHLLQRCRHGDCCRRLFGGRGTDRGHRSRSSAFRASARAAIAMSSAAEFGRTSRLWCAASPSRATWSICLGAGNITQWAYALPGELQALG